MRIVVSGLLRFTVLRNEEEAEEQLENNRVPAAEVSVREEFGEGGVGPSFMLDV